MQYSKLNINNAALVSGVVELINKEYNNDLTNASITEVEDIDRHSFVAHEAGTVHGFILISIPRKNPLINHFIVDEQQRGRKIGKQLIEMCLQDIEGYSQTHGNAYDSVYLHVPTIAEEAQKTYEKNGFAYDGGVSRGLGTASRRMRRNVPLN